MTHSQPRLAWFSPMPPVRSGIAVCSADLVGLLAADYTIDVYVDRGADAASSAAPIRSAHDFPWRHRRQPYDLTVYQFGNSSFHDFLWPYAFRYPGLAVLHDAHLHHARAAALLRTKRADDYRAEFAANHPGAPPGMAEMAVAGFDNHLIYATPMTRLVAERSRLTAVHTPELAARLREQLPGAAVAAVRLGQGRLVSDDEADAARRRFRAAYAIAADAVVFGIFGGLTPEKRVPQALDALAATLPYAPGARLLLAGATAAHYDLAADLRARRLEDHVTVTGYLDTDDELTDAVAACDVALSLRWPTAREVSGPWLRALAAGRATVTIDLVHQTHVPALDPRTWKMQHAAIRDPRSAIRDPITVAIDILDEDHSLRLAMRRLARDPALRASLGTAARAYWLREHSPEVMASDYRQLIEDARARPVPSPALPDHLLSDGGRRLAALMASMGGRPAAAGDVFSAAPASLFDARSEP